MSISQITGEIRKKYAGWEQKLFNFIANHKTDKPEATIQFNEMTELSVRYTYSSPEAASIEVSFKSEHVKNAKMIFIKIKDDFYAAYPNELSMPSHAFQYLLEILDYRERKAAE